MAQIALKEMCTNKYMGPTVVDLEGVQGVHLNPPLGAKLIQFQFHKEILEKSDKMCKTNPPLSEFEPPFQKSWILLWGQTDLVSLDIV